MSTLHFFVTAFATIFIYLKKKKKKFKNTLMYTV